MGIKNTLQSCFEDHIGQSLWKRLQCLISSSKFQLLSSQDRTGQSEREKNKTANFKQMIDIIKNFFFGLEGQMCQKQPLAEALCKKEALLKF